MRLGIIGEDFKRTSNEAFPLFYDIRLSLRTLWGRLIEEEEDLQQVFHRVTGDPQQRAVALEAATGEP